MAISFCRCPNCCGSGKWEQATTSGGRASSCPRCHGAGTVEQSALEPDEIWVAFEKAYRP